MNPNQGNRISTDYNNQIKAFYIWHYFSVKLLGGHHIAVWNSGF